MPSLRRSLILYFLVLVGLALGGMGLLIDRFAADFSAARLESETRRIDAEAAAAAQDLREKLDADLLVEARRLALHYQDKMRTAGRLLSLRTVSDEHTRAFNVALQLMPVGDNGNVLATFVAAAATHPSTGIPRNPNPFLGTRAQLFNQYWTAVVRDHTDQARAEFQTAGEHPQLFQLHLASRDPKDRQLLRSARLPVELPTNFPHDEATDSRYDDMPVPGVGLTRRIVYRAPFSVFVPRPFGFSGPGGGGPGGGRPGGGGGGERPPLVGPPAPRPERPNTGPPPLVVQIAQSKADLDAAIVAVRVKRDEQLTTIADEARDGLHRLRMRIATIGGVTFLAVVFGGWLLTGVGLSPLRKLSDAVSKVNEKDFRLPIEKRELTTELVPIHDRLTHSLDALRAAFEREKAAVADISHELRTPVAGMLATMDVALRKPRTAEQYKETLTECRAIAKQLGSLVERVMTLAYLDAGHTPQPPIPVDIGELAGGCASVIRPLATAHGLTLKTDLPPQVEFTTDPDRLREVLMNLLHNAIEYNRPGGSITLRAARDTAGLTVEVADTGIGMSDDVKAKIFDRFFRADPSRTATGAHAGLGLAIVKEAVNRMGGTIAVDSTPADGSTFRVRLPG